MYPKADLDNMKGEEMTKTTSNLALYDGEIIEGTSTAILPAHDMEPSATALAPVEDIRAQIERAEVLGEALERIQALVVKRTFASDWVSMGNSVYLEGDGALRIAPLLGLRLKNLHQEREVKQNGHVSVTLRADTYSRLLGTEYPGVERTRSTDDQFLSRGKGRADVEDVVSACYKGLIAKAVQMHAGLSGLTAEDLQGRFGVKAGSGVQYQKTQETAAKTQSAAVVAPDAVAQIQALLNELSDGDPQLAGDILERVTENKAKGWPGKREAGKLTEKGVAYVLKVLTEKVTKLREEQGGEQ